MFRIVIPVAKTESQLAFDLLAHIAAEEDSAKNYLLTVVLANGMEGELGAFREAAAKVTNQSHVAVCAADTPDMNSIFRTTVQHLADIGNRVPWLWMDAKSTPMTRETSRQVAMAAIGIMTEFVRKSKKSRNCIARS